MKLVEYRLVGAHGPAKKKREQEEAFLFGLREIKSGCGSVEVLCFMVDLNTQVVYVKISEVIGGFGVEGVNSNRELMLKMFV